MAIRKLTIDFLRTEAGAGALLALAAAMAMICANSGLSGPYNQFVHYQMTLVLGPVVHTTGLGEWVKEGLMAVFFYVVGLEIKYEVLRGELSDPKKLALPVVAAIGGMLMPALVYALINLNGGDLTGWSVPVATDIAFALAVLAMAGSYLPPSLRVFLMTLAIVDDLGAVLIIGVFYGSGFNLLYLSLMAAVMSVMWLLPHLFRGVRGIGIAYLALFGLVWLLCLNSGVSPSLAAVLSAFCVTLKAPGPGQMGVLKCLMHAIHPYVAYIILPLFAFTAAGVRFGDEASEVLTDLTFVGIVAGLFIGKPLGVFAASWLMIRSGFARLPDGADHKGLMAVAILCGIGFTMSLFIGDMAFKGYAEKAHIAVKLGVLTGSLLSVFAGAIWLRMLKRKASSVT
jgi:Na+:H+ antiporter, NhaA family